MRSIEKSNLSERFAQRLRESLIAAGYSSTRTPSGVDIFSFAALIGHSPQICRKYLRGQALPSSSKLEEIAKILNVSPGWLLFGDCHSQHSPAEDNKITINKELLHYIFSHMSSLYQSEGPSNQYSDFFLELTQDVSQINADPEQSKKIVDLSLSSARQFKKDL